MVTCLNNNNYFKLCMRLLNINYYDMNYYKLRYKYNLRMLI